MGGPSIALGTPAGERARRRAIRRVKGDLRHFATTWQYNSNGLQPKSDGPQPKSKLYQTFLTFLFVSNSNGLQPKSDGPQPKSKLYQTFLTFFCF